MRAGTGTRPAGTGYSTRCTTWVSKVLVIVKPIRDEHHVTVLSLFDGELVHDSRPAGPAVVDGDAHVAALPARDAAVVVVDPRKRTLVFGAAQKLQVPFGVPDPHQRRGFA